MQLGLSLPTSTADSKETKAVPRIVFATLEEYFTTFDSTKPPQQNAEELTDKLIGVILAHTAAANAGVINTSKFNFVRKIVRNGLYNLLQDGFTEFQQIANQNGLGLFLANLQRVVVDFAKEVPTLVNLGGITEACQELKNAFEEYRGSSQAVFIRDDYQPLKQNINLYKKRVHHHLAQLTTELKQDSLVVKDEAGNIDHPQSLAQIDQAIKKLQRERSGLLAQLDATSHVLELAEQEEKAKNAKKWTQKTVKWAQEKVKWAQKTVPGKIISTVPVKIISEVWAGTKFVAGWVGINDVGYTLARSVVGEPPITQKQVIESTISELNGKLETHSKLKLKLNAKKDIESTLQDISTLHRTAIKLQIQKLTALVYHLESTIQKLTTYQVKKGVTPTISVPTKESSNGWFAGIAATMSTWYKARSFSKDFWGILSYVSDYAAEKFSRLVSKDSFRAYKLTAVEPLVTSAYHTKTSAETILTRLRQIEQKSESEADAVLLAQDFAALEADLTQKLGGYQKLFAAAEQQMDGQVTFFKAMHQEDASYYDSSSLASTFKQANILPLKIK